MEIYRKRWMYIAAGGQEKWCPTAAIIPQKCARRHFENANGRENTEKSRPLEQKMLAIGHVRRGRKGCPASAGMDLLAQLIYFYCIFEMFRIKKLFKQL